VNGFIVIEFVEDPGIILQISLAAALVLSVIAFADVLIIVNDRLDVSAGNDHVGVPPPLNTYDIDPAGMLYVVELVVVTVVVLAVPL
jgi:hypothetical protein